MKVYPSFCYKYKLYFVVFSFFLYLILFSNKRSYGSYTWHGIPKLVERLREYVTIEENMMKYHALWHKKLIGKVLAEEFAIFRIKLSFLTNIPYKRILMPSVFTIKREKI